MTAKNALKGEIEKRRVQLTKLKDALEEQEEDTDIDAKRSLALLKRAGLSFAGAEAQIDQGNYSEGAYLFAQGCWGLGCAHGISRRL